MQWRTVLYVTQRAIILKINPQGKYASIVDLSLAPNLASFFQRRMNVRFGSKADIRSAKGDVRFTPESGHVQCKSVCPLSANGGHPRNKLHELNKTTPGSRFLSAAILQDRPLALICI